MKKNFVYLFTMLCTLSFFTACSDDDDKKDPNGLDLNASYSGDKLDLKYDNAVLLGKDVTFDTRDGKTATITMKGSSDYILELIALMKSSPVITVAPGVIPGEVFTSLSNVPLTLSGEKYTFEGTESSNGCSFKYAGSVEKDKLTLSLDDVKMPSNDLVGNWKLASQPLSIVWKSDAMIDLTALGVGKVPLSVAAPALGGMVGPMLKNVLNEVSFAGDGNIVAGYKKSGATDWQSSPLNLAQYYVKGNEMYVQLNVAQILATVAANKSKATSPAPALIKYLAQYLSTGIPLSYSVSGETAQITAGKELLMELLSVLSNEEIQGLFLPKLMQKVPEGLKPVVQDLLKNLPEILAKTEDISVTLNLEKR